MSKTIRVTAPYVTLKVTDAVNGTVLVGYYEGAIVENVDDASAKHHIDSGMAVAVKADAEPAGPPLVPEELRGDYSQNVASLDTSLLAGDATRVTASEEPAGNASAEEWEAYARSQGATDADLVDSDGKPLGRNEIRDQYQS